MAISRIYGTLRYSRPDAPGIADLDPTQQTVMHALIASPLKVDDIAALVSLDAVGVLKLLGSLELEGLIERMMDGRYAPSKFALLSTICLQIQNRYLCSDLPWHGHRPRRRRGRPDGRQTDSPAAAGGLCR